MEQRYPKYKLLQQVINTEKYRTDTSSLLAYNENKKQFLFRALNSSYFLQNDNDESIEALEMDEAKQIWNKMPSKHITNIVEAFPKYHVRISVSPYTNLHDEI